MTELNTTIFFFFNGMAGQSIVFDQVVVFLGDYLAYILVATSLIILILWKTTDDKKIRALSGAIASVVVGRGIFVELIRFFYSHPRPFAALSGVHQLLTETGSSFPSGHATFFFALSAFIYRHHKIWGMVFFVLSGIMGLARVVAGVHYPLDILGGAVLGTFIGLVSFRLSETYFVKKI